MASQRRIPIYHSDGTYLAKVRGTRIYATEEGQKAGLTLSSPPDMTVCKLDGRTVFEIYHQPGNAFRTSAELFTPTGYFLKCDDSPKPGLFSASGDALQVGGMTMSGNLFQGCRIGVWVKSSGQLLVGVG